MTSSSWSGRVRASPAPITRTAATSTRGRPIASASATRDGGGDRAAEVGQEDQTGDRERQRERRGRAAGSRGSCRPRRSRPSGGTGSRPAPRRPGSSGAGPPSASSRGSLLVEGDRLGQQPPERDRHDQGGRGQQPDAPPPRGRVGHRGGEQPSADAAEGVARDVEAHRRTEPARMRLGRRRDPSPPRPPRPAPRPTRARSTIRLPNVGAAAASRVSSTASSRPGRAWCGPGPSGSPARRPAARTGPARRCWRRRPGWPGLGLTPNSSLICGRTGCAAYRMPNAPRPASTIARLNRR